VIGTPIASIFDLRRIWSESGSARGRPSRWRIAADVSPARPISPISAHCSMASMAWC